MLIKGVIVVSFCDWCYDPWPSMVDASLCFRESTKCNQKQKKSTSMSYLQMSETFATLFIGSASKGVLRLCVLTIQKSFCQGGSVAA